MLLIGRHRTDSAIPTSSMADIAIENYIEVFGENPLEAGCGE